eukprot:COSAG04_NODE_8310_length_992_cov_2.206047_1_plen_209_part_00
MHTDIFIAHNITQITAATASPPPARRHRPPSTPTSPRPPAARRPPSRSLHPPSPDRTYSTRTTCPCGSGPRFSAKLECRFSGSQPCRASSPRPTPTSPPAPAPLSTGRHLTPTQPRPSSLTTDAFHYLYAIARLLPSPFSRAHRPDFGDRFDEIHTMRHGSDREERGQPAVRPTHGRRQLCGGLARPPRRPAQRTDPVAERAAGGGRP